MSLGQGKRGAVTGSQGVSGCPASESACGVRNQAPHLSTRGSSPNPSSADDMSLSQSVLAAVIRSDTAYLLCQRPTQKRHGGLWEFPGGKVEQAETLEQAARRELREELGVELQRLGPTLLTVNDPGSIFTIHFTEVAILGVPRALEHTDVKWVPLEDLPSYPLAPSDRAFVEYLLRSRT